MKYSEEIRLFNVFYTYGGVYEYETTTDNFDKWLEYHNKERTNSGEEEDDSSDFETEDVDVILFEEIK